MGTDPAALNGHAKRGVDSFCALLATVEVEHPDRLARFNGAVAEIKDEIMADLMDAPTLEEGADRLERSILLAVAQMVEALMQVHEHRVKAASVTPVAGIVEGSDQHK